MLGILNSPWLAILIWDENLGWGQDRSDRSDRIDQDGLLDDDLVNPNKSPLMG